MAYTQTTWQDGVTAVNAANLNHIEAALGSQDGRITTVEGNPVVPSPSGQDGKWLTVAGGAMVWQALPASGGGGGLDWEGAYNSGTAYVKGDVVTYQGITYGAVNDGQGNTPPPVPAPAMTAIPLVTALPASPFDGQEVILCDSLTAPTYRWRLRYNAGATGTYKWGFVGGDESSVFIPTDETTTTLATYVNLATVGPSFVVPRAGDYEVQLRASVSCTSTQTNAQIAAGPGDFSSPVTECQLISGLPAVNSYHHISGRGRLTGLTAGQEVRVKYAFYTTAGTFHALNRSLSVRPVRVA